MKLKLTIVEKAIEQAEPEMKEGDDEEGAISDEDGDNTSSSVKRQILLVLQSNEHYSALAREVGLEDDELSKVKLCIEHIEASDTIVIKS